MFKLVAKDKNRHVLYEDDALRAMCTIIFKQASPNTYRYAIVTKVGISERFDACIYIRILLAHAAKYCWQHECNHIKLVANIRPDVLKPLSRILKEELYYDEHIIYQQENWPPKNVDNKKIPKEPPNLQMATIFDEKELLNVFFDDDMECSLRISFQLLVHGLFNYLDCDLLDKKNTCLVVDPKGRFPDQLVTKFRYPKRGFLYYNFKNKMAVIFDQNVIDYFQKLIKHEMWKNHLATRFNGVST